MTVLAWVSSIAAVASAAAALFAFLASRRLAKIEQDRRHDELRPEFRISFRDVNTTAKTAKLAIELAGPSALDRLDSIVVSFRTDGMMRDEVDNVFGPVRFEHGTDDAPSRTKSAARPINRGEFVILQVAKTTSHAEGWDDATWAQMFRSQPVRLRIDCTKSGREPWFVTMDVDSSPLVDIYGDVW
jgi:hypothetical protein